ncbi:MAG TPA: DUF2167 domain-containing protein [Longimicrobium sp.]|nr:DUF2167 domain-containing protein [Longimicrobium sp.]
MKASLRTSATLLAALAIAAPARAQGPNAETEAAPSASDKLFAGIQWQKGPDSARIGAESRVAVPENCEFTGATGARDFMLATENTPSGNELGMLLCSAGEESQPWFVMFSFDNSGYVRDDDAGELDADAILSSLREGTKQDNENRKTRGWGTMTLSGWVRPPFYDPRTNNLTWATNIVDDATRDASVNHSVRLLGRGGVMHVDLVVDPSQMAATVPEFDRIVATHAFVPGKRYSEWREGDKMAAYGVTALVGGGAVAIAAKSGLLGKLMKFIVLAVVGIGAWLRSLFMGKKRDGGRPE